MNSINWLRSRSGEVGDEVGDGQIFAAVLVSMGVACSPYTVAVACLTHIHSSETDNNEEGNVKVSDESLWKVNDTLNALQ
jgi:hypothetical protein